MRRFTPAPLTLLWLAACTGDQNVGKTNAEPTATITAPSDGSSVAAGTLLTLRGAASDPDDDEASLSAEWRSGEATLCTGAVAADGSTTCEWTATGEEAILTLIVTDPDGAAATDAVTVQPVANGAPTVTLSHPLDGATFAYDEIVTVDGTVADGEDFATSLVLSFTDGGATIELPVSIDSSGNFAGTATFEPGEHTLLATVTDTDGATGQSTIHTFTVAEQNLPPTCALTTLDGGFSQLGTPVTFEGMVGDAEAGASSVAVTWESDLDGILELSLPDAKGAVAVTTSDLTAGEHRITLLAVDPAGATCTDQIAWRVGEPPTVRINAPTDGDVVIAGDSVTFSGRALDGEDAATDLEILWESDRDGVLANDPADSSGNTTFVASDLSPGDHVVSLTATDSDGLYTTDQIVLTVDGPPSAPTVTLSPASPGTDDDLAATIAADGVDPEGLPVSYRYEWYVDGSPSSASTSATLPASATTRGQVWRVDVYPSDGSTEGLPGEASVTIGNTAPSISSVEISPNPAGEGDVLTCTVVGGADPDGDAINYTYAWEINGSAAFATGMTLASTYFGSGDEIRCSATPSDGRASGATVWSSPVEIGNSAPVAGTVALYPPTPATNDTILAAPGGSDPDGDVINWSYTWYVDGAPVAETSDHLDGTVYFQRGQTVYVVVTPDDGSATGAPLTSATLTVANTPPTVVSPTLTPSPAYEDTILTCAPGATNDDDGDSVNLSYAWEVNGVLRAVSTSTLDGGVFSAGDSVRCFVTPSDGTDVGPAVASSIVDILDTAPIEARVTLAPSPALTDDTLTATANARDLDEDTITWSYQWYVDGAPVGEDAPTLDGTAWFSRDAVVTVVATPYGAGVAGDPASADITISDTPPTVTSVTLGPDPAYERSTLVCAATTDDADADTVSLSYTWQVDGLTIGETDATLTGTSFAAGDRVTCTVTPSDGTRTGDAATSNELTIGNTAPVAASVTLSPTSPTTTDVVTATATGSDADGDSLTWHYTWFVNGARVPASGDTLNGVTEFGKGDTVSVTVEADDGVALSASVSSDTITVVNSPPTAPTIEIQPADPIEGVDALRCVVTTASTDADADPISYAAAWTVNDADFTGVTTSFAGDTVPAGDTVAEDEWVCTVTPSDTEGPGASATTSTFVLGDPVDYGHVQFPCSASVAAGDTFDVYVWVFEPAVTQGVGQGAGIRVEVGVGADGSDPERDEWAWVAATYNADKDGPYAGDRANDEYLGVVTAPATPGDYDYAARVSTDSGLSWLYVDLGGDYCGLIGTTDGYEPTTAGALTAY